MAGSTVRPVSAWAREESKGSSNGNADLKMVGDMAMDLVVTAVIEARMERSENDEAHSLRCKLKKCFCLLGMIERM